jgi:hypothetical protein
MNIEPIAKARQILKAHDQNRYVIFQDRLDIVTTLMGIEDGLGVFEGHAREGDSVNQKYIELAEYCRYAERLEWTDMKAMRDGLKLDEKPPILKESIRQKNNLLRTLDMVLGNAVPEYQDGKRNRSPAAVLKWLKEKGETDMVSDATLSSWFAQMQDLEARQNADDSRQVR